MDNEVFKTAVITFGFNDEFPKVGQQTEIVTKSNEERLITIYEVKNYRWYIQNGQVEGVQADITYMINEVTRPSSEGKLRLIEKGKEQ